VGKLPAIRTRTSLVGAKIYPASVEPSKRAKQIIAALADQCDETSKGFPPISSSRFRTKKSAT